MQYNYSQDTPLENTLPTTLSDELQIAIGDYITDPRATRSRNRDIIEAGILLFNCNNYLRYPFQFQDISPPAECYSKYHCAVFILWFESKNCIHLNP